MRCVIVGAAGFIGGHLARRLAASGQDVLGLDVVEPDDFGTEFRRWDAMREDLDLEPAEVVFYLSQSPHYREFPSGGDHLFGVNLVGALRAAAAASAAGAKLFVYASTGSVYAPSFSPMDEGSAVRRDDAYALSKLAAEEALRLAPRGLQVLCVRPFGVFGPGQKTMLVPAITARVRDGRPVTIERNPLDPNDDGGLRISLTFVDDVVACFEQLASLAAADGVALPGVLNVACAEAVSIRQLADAVGRRLGVPPRYELVERARESDFIADIGRLRGLVEPVFTPFADAIASTIEVGS
jgi:UDP-glucose 4-epimerase